MSKYVCTECGSDDIEVRMWVGANDYDNADVVKCQRDFDGTQYFEECLDIANDALYNHMVEIKETV